MSALRIMFLLGLAVGAARAADVGPSHCFQAAESLNAKLAALGGEERGPLPDAGAPAAVPRNPRHCFFKALEVFDGVQRLRESKELAPAPLPEVPDGALAPKDVLAVVTAATTSLSELDKAFPSAKTGAEAALVQGKTPGDVFNSLSEAQLRLAKLGAPAFGPSDCFRMAMCAQAELEALRKARNLTEPVADAKTFTGKKPGDCYDQARGLLEDLAKVAASDAKLKVAGIQVPGARSGDVKPGHVLDLLGSATADAAAPKAAAGGTDRVRLPAPVHGKTPSDVFAQIARARAMARSLLPK
jgi:hypothetical protein